MFVNEHDASHTRINVAIPAMWFENMKAKKANKNKPRRFGTKIRENILHNMKNFLTA